MEKHQNLCEQKKEETWSAAGRNRDIFCPGWMLFVGPLLPLLLSDLLYYVWVWLFSECQGFLWIRWVVAGAFLYTAVKMVLKGYDFHISSPRGFVSFPLSSLLLLFLIIINLVKVGWRSASQTLNPLSLHVSANVMFNLGVSMDPLRNSLKGNLN